MDSAGLWWNISEYVLRNMLDCDGKHGAMLRIVVE